MAKKSGTAKRRIRKSENFPDGLRLSDYGDYSRLTQEQWAWEFLRRSARYQVWYDQSGIWLDGEGGGEESDFEDEERWDIGRPTSDEDRDRMLTECRAFGLRQAKEWRSSGQGFATTPPAFITGALADHYCRRHERDFDGYEADVRVGELVVKFDLREIELVSGVLDRQLALVREKILGELGAINSQAGDIKTRLRDSHSWITLIRLMDALSRRVPLEQRIQIIGRHKGGLNRRREFQRAVEAVKTMTKRARAMCDGKYLEILALTDHEFAGRIREAIVAQWKRESMDTQRRGISYIVGEGIREA